MSGGGDLGSGQAWAAWLVAGVTILCVLTRPWNRGEAWWATGGAAVMVLCGLLPWGAAGQAVGRGLDVYLFLAGMMLLSELARREGVFDWCASLAVRHARGSPGRLFLLIYGVGVVITVFLSNDATAVVLTPAVFAVTKTARVERPLPYLYACALVANAASFVLPISNPANLVFFDGKVPPLLEWLRMFGGASVLSILATISALYLVMGKELGDARLPTGPEVKLGGTGRVALAGIALAVLVLLGASAAHRDLGAPTLTAGVAVLGLVAVRDGRALWEVPREVAWSVLPLVAGLFVMVEGVNRAGALRASEWALQGLARSPGWERDLAGAWGVTALSNVINNLPSGLITGTAVTATHLPETLRNALMIGVDLGPNLSVTGSLATILWLIALRREGERVGIWSFLKVGALVTPVALVLAVLASSLGAPGGR